jgi:hypothetical protein
MNAIPTPRGGARRFWLRGIGILLALYVLIVLALMWWWSYEPAQFEVVKFAQERSARHNQPVVTGSVVTATLIGSAETLLDKRGGYLQRQVPAGRADG